MTKYFQFFHWYYLRPSQKRLFSTFLCRNGHRNMTSHVTLAFTFLLFLSFLLDLYTKFRCAKTFWCILKVFKWFFNFDKNGFQGVWPTVPCHQLPSKIQRTANYPHKIWSFELQFMRNRDVLSSITTPLTVACSQCNFDEPWYTVHT